MVQLNTRGEVADFVNESQFEQGESAYECVAFSAALIKYAGQPGKGPTGTGEQVDQTADFWYGKLEGSYAASNTNGMSLDAEYMMLRGMGLPFKPLAPSVAAIKGALQQGYPVMLCGAETGMHDLDLGGRVPYSWTPSGNHCIVACGIASDGNLLVRDTASIAPGGVRPGPRRYLASALQIVSATAIIVPWEVTTMIDITTPGVSNYFDAVDAHHWHCKQTGRVIQFGILEFYKAFGGNALCGLTHLGLPVSPEIPIDAHGNTMQHFERGVLFYDPQHMLDKPPGAGMVYMAKLYTGPGQDPNLAKLGAQVAAEQATITTLEAELAAALAKTTTGIDPAEVLRFQTGIAAQIQALGAAVMVPLK
jgi:hypothetical protein